MRRVVTGMSVKGAGLGKVVVNRAMSLDGFIAGPANEMDWVFSYLNEDRFPEVMAATGAMLVGRRTHEVAKRMPDEDTDYDGGPVFVLTHQPPDEPEQGVTFLTCDLAEAVATARAVAGGRNLGILGADLASQCLQRGLVDESWSMSCLCCLATACASRPRRSAFGPALGSGPDGSQCGLLGEFVCSAVPLRHGVGAFVSPEGHGVVVRVVVGVVDAVAKVGSEPAMSCALSTYGFVGDVT